MSEKKCDLFKTEKKPVNSVRCSACSHRCLIEQGNTGICGVRKNVFGKLYLLSYERVSSMNVDPIEKKPLRRFLPGSRAFSIGAVGCNLKCEWCQNFSISQAGKEGGIFGNEMTAEQIVEEAIKTGCRSVAYTYNEPIISAEFYKEIAILAKKKSLHNVFVTNGYWTKESLEYFTKSKLIDAMNIDLKCFDEKIHLKYCGAKLKPVLETIKRAVKSGIHVEITTLIVPGVSDDEKQLKAVAKFIFNLDKRGNIPWHISRFFPMYHMKDKSITPVEIMKKAELIGKKAGLKYVSLGNV